MSFETALRARVKALPEVVSAASSVDWSVRPQGAFTSAIVLTVAYDPRGRTMTGWQGWIPTRVYIDVMAASAPVKAALRDAILALIGVEAVAADARFWPARDVSITDLSEQADTQFIHRDQIDAIIPHMQETDNG
ncbi:hypothetical protein DFR49_3363 [Hephaestia caeni]|uniref:Uncharacterized protein n=1 Tax=Hephaestia caeni TaxID=645617 RepID=A0A397NM79_9SPHN|nr:hypothetical protein [Hephaestia caeni]RIA37478.1 hypothetical protein DFR49_3363 [Hephaestia caeni]